MLVLTTTLLEIAEVRKCDVFHWKERGYLTTPSKRWTALMWEPREVLIAAVLRTFQVDAGGQLPGMPWVEQVPPLLREQWPNYSKHWIFVQKQSARLLTTGALERRLATEQKRAMIVLDVLPLFSRITESLRAELRREDGLRGVPRLPLPPGLVSAPSR